ncbi:hypothetical protein ACE38V_08665 [Cytobacillus sp. Hz8]
MITLVIVLIIYLVLTVVFVKWRKRKIG